MAAPKSTVYGKMLEILNARTAATYTAYLLPSIKPKMQILDVGCGPGSITFGLAELVFEGSVVGVDISDAFIDHAKTMKRARGPSNIDLMTGVAMDLHQFDDESFDIVHAHQVIIHLPSQKKSLREIRQILKRGGLLATRDMATSTPIQRV